MTVLTGGAVELAKNFINDKSYKGKVTSTLIYGVQWDATMQFFDNSYINGTPSSDSYVRNSRGKGWYEEIAGSSIMPTGINVDERASNKIKNIYDMAGNVWEWTMEASDDNGRVLRGGMIDDYGDSRPASYRHAYSQSFSMGSLGFRLALYF